MNDDEPETELPEPPPPDKAGRPRHYDFDLDTVEKLGGLQCTLVEVAGWYGCHVNTFKNRIRNDPELAQAFENGKRKGLVSLRRSQFSLAKRNPTMAIWLGKQYLEQRDEKYIHHDDVEKMTDGELRDYIAELEQELGVAAEGAGRAGAPGSQGPSAREPGKLH